MEISGIASVLSLIDEDLNMLRERLKANYRRGLDDTQGVQIYLKGRIESLMKLRNKLN